jgi:hypothetical protein
LPISKQILEVIDYSNDRPLFSQGCEFAEGRPPCRKIFQAQGLTRPACQFTDEICSIQFGSLRRSDKVEGLDGSIPGMGEQIGLTDLSSSIENRQLLAPCCGEMAQRDAFFFAIYQEWTIHRAS